MTEDQLQRLRALQDKLVETALGNADPASWTADGKVSKDMDKEERGNAYWDRKLAGATLAVLARIVTLTTISWRNMPENDEEGRAAALAAAGTLDDDVKAAERQAKEMLKLVEKAARERASKPTH